MNEDFRQRVLLPLILPLAIIGAIALITISLSRVMLAVPETVATLAALLLAAYVLLICGLVAARPRVSSRTLGAGLVIGLLAIAGAGVAGAQAGIRDLHHEEAVADEDVEADADLLAEVPEDALVFIASDDLIYPEAPETASSGGVEMALVNEGALFHDVVIEETGEEILAADGGEVDVQTVDLDPGSYVYFCSVAGHREAGMEGTIEVE